MGKPRLIVLARHAESQANLDLSIHRHIADHLVKLTPRGRAQALEAGRKLRCMLKPDDTIQIFLSPYQRTRETTEGILDSLTSDDPDPTPFPRGEITVHEDARLREQEFGNYQRNDMKKIWSERSRYGHFFYRIPDGGESGADVFDRVSGFNESLWRSFGDEDFPSVCLLVTHGLTLRAFLMRWYHFSVEYFESLVNFGHCEFVVMRLTGSKYVLQNQLRTWGPPSSGPDTKPVGVPERNWTHHASKYPRRKRRQNTFVAEGEDGKASVALGGKGDGAAAGLSDVALSRTTSSVSCSSEDTETVADLKPCDTAGTGTSLVPKVSRGETEVSIKLSSDQLEGLLRQRDVAGGASIQLTEEQIAGVLKDRERSSMDEVY